MSEGNKEYCINRAKTRRPSEDANQLLISYEIATN